MLAAVVVSILVSVLQSLELHLGVVDDSACDFRHGFGSFDFFLELLVCEIVVVDMFLTLKKIVVEVIE